jgi:hypothetical protein
MRSVGGRAVALGTLIVLAVAGVVVTVVAARRSEPGRSVVVVARGGAPTTVEPGLAMASARAGVHSAAVVRRLGGCARCSVDEVALAAPVRATVGGRAQTVSTAVRLVIRGRFVVRALSADVIVDGRRIGAGLESRDLDSIGVLLFDRSVLHDGATVAYAYGSEAPIVVGKLSMGGSR